MDLKSFWKRSSKTQPTDRLYQPRIKVIGIGNAGCSVISRMYPNKALGVEYYAINSELRQLSNTDADYRIPLGSKYGVGLGCGALPNLARQYAEEDSYELKKAISGADLVILTGGLGGGTGTGAGPVVAGVARESGASTIAIFTTPFSFESFARRRNSDEGIVKLDNAVDCLITIPSDDVLEQIRPRIETTWEEALSLSYSTLQEGVQTLIEFSMPRPDNSIDFSEMMTLLSDCKPMSLAIGSGKGINKAVEAAEAAAYSPWSRAGLNPIILMMVSGDSKLKTEEVNKAVDQLGRYFDTGRKINLLTTWDPTLQDEMKITIFLRPQGIQKTVCDMSWEPARLDPDPQDFFNSKSHTI